jgi:hypothetical protein
MLAYIHRCANYVYARVLMQRILLHIQIPTHACTYVVCVCVRALHDEVDVRVLVFALSHANIYMNTHIKIVCACVNKVDVCTYIHADTHICMHIYRHCACMCELLYAVIILCLPLRC